jgi:hypothetical protein
VTTVHYRYYVIGIGKTKSAGRFYRSVHRNVKTIANQSFLEANQVNTIVRLLCVTACIFIAVDSSYTQWFETAEPYRGIGFITVPASPKDPTASKHNVVYRSTDNGVSWVKTDIVSHAVDPYSSTSVNLFSETNHFVWIAPLTWNVPADSANVHVSNERSNGPNRIHPFASYSSTKSDSSSFFDIHGERFSMLFPRVGETDMQTWK